MSYIRTKDGVYEVKVNKYHELVYCKNNQIVLSCNILKQSENLEELCDEFVEKCNDNPKITNPFVIPMWDKEFIKETLKRGNTIYGAIWTQRGLIYVSKMDNEGKLVLI